MKLRYLVFTKIRKQEECEVIKELSKCIREYKAASIKAPIYVSLEVVMECIIPFIIAQLVNEIKAGCSFSVIATYGLILLVMAAVSLVFGVMAGTAAATGSCGFAKNLRKDMFYKIQTYSFKNIDRFSTSSLVTRLTTDVMNVQMAYMMIIRIAIRCPLMLIFSFTMAFVMGGKMAWIFVILVPVLGVGLALIIRLTMPLFRKVFKKYDRLNNSIQENVKGIRVVKSYVREEYEKEKFGAAADDICQDFTRAEKILAFNNPLMQFCMYAVMIFVLSFGSYVIISSRGLDLDVGQFSALLTYSFQILSSLMMISMVFVMITMASESAKRIVEVLSEESTIKNPEHPVYEVRDGSIEFEKVNFKYSKNAEKMALANIDLHIKSGETIGVIGGTGSSKSSLIQLISRLYDVTEGCVKVGGRDVKEYDLETLRNQVSVVLQKNILFSGTIKENLRWGNKEATDEELIEACKLAQADEFIRQFPAGYDTHIEQRRADQRRIVRLCSAGSKENLLLLHFQCIRDRLLCLANQIFCFHTFSVLRRRVSVVDAHCINDRILYAVQHLGGRRIIKIGFHFYLYLLCNFPITLPTAASVPTAYTSLPSPSAKFSFQALRSPPCFPWQARLLRPQNRPLDR